MNEALYSVPMCVYAYSIRIHVCKHVVCNMKIICMKDHIPSGHNYNDINFTTFCRGTSRRRYF